MKQLFWIVSILFPFFFALSSFAQKGYYEQELEMPFQPRFTLGSGYYSSQGDIVGPKANSLLGNIGFKAGVRFNINQNTDLSLLFTDFKLSETSTSRFSSELNSIGLHLDYTFNNVFKQSKLSPFITFGAQSSSYKTVYWDENEERTIFPKESMFSFPLGLGLALDISERIRMDLGINYVVSLGDIDMHELESSSTDNFILMDFTIHYDFFTLNPARKVTDDSYYSDVNFKALDAEDEDADLVPDIDDHCPQTPQGVDVDEKGCPLDDDNDGIPNYLDKELNTMDGALVDENGVQLTEEQYQSMYAYEAASRKYANAYNLSEINKGDYQTINDYLIAKANAFNQAYNDGEDLEDMVKGLRYKVQIAKYNNEVPEDIQTKLLSIDDLESISQDDGYVIYSVGSYNSIEDALGRSNELEINGFNDVYFLTDNNGVISDYVPPVTNPDPIIEKEDSDQEKEASNKEKKVVVDTTPTYRVQIGAYEVVLSKEIFSGIKNVIHMKDKDGFIKYMTGSFSDKKQAIDYMFEMRARGFEDAFVVGYKNGKRNIEYFVPQKNKSALEQSNKVDVDGNITDNNLNEESTEVIINLQFTVQILVAKEPLDAASIEKMRRLGSNISKKTAGVDMYRYFAGVYSSLKEAENRLIEAQDIGYKDAFIFATLDGERITLLEAESLIKE